MGCHTSQVGQRLLSGARADQGDQAVRDQVRSRPREGEVWPEDKSVAELRLEPVLPLLASSSPQTHSARGLPAGGVSRSWVFLLQGPGTHPCGSAVATRTLRNTQPQERMQQKRGSLAHLWPAWPGDRVAEDERLGGAAGSSPAPAGICTAIGAPSSCNSVGCTQGTWTFRTCVPNEPKPQGVNPTSS